MNWLMSTIRLVKLPAWLALIIQKADAMIKSTKITQIGYFGQVKQLQISIPGLSMTGLN